MHHFPVLRTKRITLQLKELSIGDSIDLASMPDHLHEASCTAFLRATLQSVKGVEDPSEWTVQERNFAIAHYLASVAENGPDFSVGGGRYSDYLDGAADNYLELHAIGEIGGDDWLIRPLTGAMAEAIERLSGEFQLPGRLHWLFGAMACQLVRKGEDIPPLEDGLLLDRMRVLAGFPGSEFELLMRGYFVGVEALHHLFSINFNDRGIVVMPNKGADGSMPPARFPVRSCISRAALDLAGQHAQSGGEFDAAHGDIGD
jgi:hypothetical protein